MTLWPLINKNIQDISNLSVNGHSSCVIAWLGSRFVDIYLKPFHNSIQILNFHLQFGSRQLSEAVLFSANKALSLSTSLAEWVWLSHLIGLNDLALIPYFPSPRHLLFSKGNHFDGSYLLHHISQLHHSPFQLRDATFLWVFIHAFLFFIHFAGILNYLFCYTVSDFMDKKEHSTLSESFEQKFPGLFGFESCGFLMIDQ